VLDTSSWQRKTLSVQDDLHLDPKNVRLETASAQVEADIVEDLFDNENAFDLVDAIGKIGYLTHEIPIVVKRKSKYVVVEGNRRLAALKAIQNPMIAPTHQSRVAAVIKKMTARERARLASIEVLVAPNQAQADQLIAALHTSNPRKPWSPARQAAFFQAQIDAGKKYKQLVSRYPTIDVADFVLRARLVNRLKSAVASEPDLAAFIGSKEWKSGFSALTRIFESKDFREATGIGLDADGDLVTSVSAETFDEVARLIVQGMQDRSINTRTLGTVKSPRFLRLMADIRAAIHGEPDGTADGTSSATSGGESGGTAGTGAGSGGGGAPGTGSGKAASPGAETGSGGSKKTAVKPTKKAKSTYLPISHIVAPSAYPAAITLHLEELSIVNIQKMPNATFMMLRAILEKSIKAYAEAKGEDIKSKRNTKGYVQLHDSLAWLVDYFKANGKKALIQPAQRVQSGKIPNYTASNDAMNAINHNHHFHVDGDEVLHLWTSIDPLMRELMKP
jgi:hypothetical protein